jgi:hypothetical protein
MCYQVFLKSSAVFYEILLSIDLVFLAHLYEISAELAGEITPAG